MTKSIKKLQYFSRAQPAMTLINTQINQASIIRLLFKFCFVWVILFIISVPFPHNFIPGIAGYTTTLFEAPVKWFAAAVLHLQKPYTTALISDSTGLYIHALLLTIYSMVIACCWTVADKNKKDHARLWYFFTVLLRCYLALQLFTYGFSKLFKWQFYLPEPNTLFTTIGNTPKDLLYWSTMGTTRAYSIFAGTAEILAAALLLFRRTSLAGALLALGILINVVAINFSFDISVKLYSIFLCFLCLLLIAPNAVRLARFFILQQQAAVKTGTVIMSNRQRIIYRFVKLLVILCILFDPLYGYIKENNFNDDKAKRPLLHGAYDVQAMLVNNDTIAPVINCTSCWRRVFIHRQGYFITQFMNDEMQDYQLQYDTTNKYLVLTDYEHQNAVRQLQYHVKNDSTVLLQGIWQKDSLQVLLKPIDIKKLPALKNEFSWTIDTAD